MNESVLNQAWSVRSLLRFALPTVIMMLFMGLYTVVDTVFVARLVDTNALSAINIVCPLINLTVGLGTMLATGGNAIISREMGAGQYRQAKEALTQLVIAGTAMGCLILVCGLVWLERILTALGASDLLFPYCKDYLAVLLLFVPANILQTLFSNLLVTAGRPGLGFGLAIAAGLANILLDYIFIVPCALGIQGAALGTGIGYLIPTVAGLSYFIWGKEVLGFVRPKWSWVVIGESCWNGSSEMVGQLATAVTTFLFNRTMLGLLGEDGVAAITIMIYTQFLLSTLYIGYSMGVAPVIGFHYGKRNTAQQKTVIAISVGFIMAASVLMFLASMLAGPWIVGVFARDDPEVYRIAAEGFQIFSYSFLFCGLNIFTSSMFTALSNGKTSALLSFLRTFGLLTGGIVLLPRIWGVTGVWLAVPVSEGIMFLISALCLVTYQNRRLL